ncbi:MAG: VWA domain-containing protein, partial [Planctomycetota bacterium]
GVLIFAAARPRWGVYFEDVQSRGVDMFVLLDVSRSMLAEDVAPNRLERAKSDIRDLLQYLQGDRVGLIAFAGAAVVQTPLTTDQGFFRLVLDDTDSDSAPRGGSLIGDAIRTALEAMEPRQDRDQVIVLITDGEDHDSFPTEAAKAAAERDVKVICVGLGDTEEGRRIPIRDEAGNLSYMKHDGQEVWSKMDEAVLKEIAVTTKGAYIPAKTTAYDLGKVYSDHLAGLTRGEINAEKRKRYRERFQLFVVLGLAALLLEMVIPRSPTGSSRWNQRLIG